MAARNNPVITAKHRAKIKTTQLINRLNKIGMGDIDVSPTQLRAIEIALRKSVPDLQSVELQGDLDGKLELSWQK